MKGLDRHIANADTAIFIVGHNTPLCAQMLGLMRAAGTLSAGASDTFEAAWRLYESHYAKDGGPFGALIHSRLRERGPVLAMGEPTETARVAEILSRKAQEISRRNLTPFFIDPIFEATVRAVAAQLSHTEGRA